MKPTLTYDADKDILLIQHDKKKIQITGEVIRSLKDIHKLDAAAEFVSIFRAEATEMTDAESCDLYTQLTQHINANYSN
jgi:hypothetical protein